MNTRIFTRDILRVVVAQLSQTIGWDSIQSTPLELMVDFLQRYLENLCKVTHRYSEQFGQTQPNLDHLGLAFQDLGIDLQDLGDYVRNVESVPCLLDVPKYPVEKDTHLNFLKPGSNEVVHRPVHVHEHLPPMHPDLEEQDKKTPMSEVTTTSADGTVSNTGVFKRPGDPLESPAMKRTRLLLEEEGRPMREISSVIMTTSGFLSPAREGKLPEARTPIFPSDIGGRSPTQPSYPTVPPEIRSEKKTKKTPSKKSLLGSKKLDKENTKKKDKDGTKSDKPKVKKLASMKETFKLKALKSKCKKIPTIAGEGNPKDFANFVQNLYQSSTQNKNKPDLISTWPIPGPSKEPIPSERVPESNILEGKLSAEPDKQKLNIFKKISKVKEEKSEKIDRDEIPRDFREMAQHVIMDEAAERPWMASSTAIVASAVEEEEVYISDTLSPPGTPSTPRTPELPSKLEKLGGKKRKKDKSKSKSKKVKLWEPPGKKPKIIEQIDLEPLERPKTPEVPAVSLFPFTPHFHAAPGLIPPPLMPSMFPTIPPRIPFLKQNLPIPPSNLPHPAMPNLPIPPSSFMQSISATIAAPQVVKEEPAPAPPEVPQTTPEKPVEKEKEKKVKESKKEDGAKKPKKKKLKKEKIKNKEKSEKKKEKEEKKIKDKEKSKEKKEKKKEREVKEKSREEKPELAVPKLTLKLGPDTSRPSTPEQNRKIVIKPVVKKEDVVVTEPKRAASPELARFSALVTRQPKKSKPTCPPSVVQTTPAETKSKESVAFYHHASSSRSTIPQQRGSSSSRQAGRGTVPGDDAGNKVWICPACRGLDDGSPMIGCDDCDAWYHWVCVGIQVPPDDKEDWYCRECIQRKQEAVTSKKKLKKKNKV